MGVDVKNGGCKQPTTPSWPVFQRPSQDSSKIAATSKYHLVRKEKTKKSPRVSLNISSSANLRMAVISAELRNPLCNSIRGSSLNTNVRVPPVPPELLDWPGMKHHMKNSTVRSAMLVVFQPQIHPGFLELGLFV